MTIPAEPKINAKGIPASDWSKIVSLVGLHLQTTVSVDSRNSSIADKIFALLYASLEGSARKAFGLNKIASAIGKIEKRGKAGDVATDMWVRNILFTTQGLPRMFYSKLQI
jgi:hypothetical protein